MEVHRSTCAVAFAAGAVAVALAMPKQVHAEPLTNRVLQGVQTTTKGGCVLMKMNFNIRIRYVSHFPRIAAQSCGSVRPIDPAQAAAEILTRRESLRPPDSRVAPREGDRVRGSAGRRPDPDDPIPAACRIQGRPGRRLRKHRHRHRRSARARSASRNIRSAPVGIGMRPSCAKPTRASRDLPAGRG